MEHLKRLEESLAVLENSADKLSQIPQLLKGIIDLTNEIQKEKDEFSSKYSELENIKTIMEKQSKDICDYIEAEKKTREEFITTMKSILIQNNKENIEVYNALSTTISHKVEVTGNNLNTSISTGMTKLSENIAGTEAKIEQSFETLNADVKETNTMIPIVFRTQILVIVAIVVGVAGCILHFI